MMRQTSGQKYNAHCSKEGNGAKLGFLGKPGSTLGRTKKGLRGGLGKGLLTGQPQEASLETHNLRHKEAQRNLFLKILRYKPQDDQCIVRIILSHISWGTSEPPPPSLRCQLIGGARHMSPERGGGGVWKGGSNNPPPPLANLFSSTPSKGTGPCRNFMAQSGVKCWSKEGPTVSPAGRASAAHWTHPPLFLEGGSRIPGLQARDTGCSNVPVAPTATTLTIGQGYSGVGHG